MAVTSVVDYWIMLSVNYLNTMLMLRSHQATQLVSECTPLVIVSYIYIRNI